MSRVAGCGERVHAWEAPRRSWALVLSLVFHLALAVTDAGAAESDALRLMPLGDSITQGYRASYREALWQALRERDWDVDFVGTMDRYYGGGPPARHYDPDHEGHWGWHADEVLARIADWAERTNPDVVLLHLGTNDVGSGQDPAGTAGEIRGIIERLRDHNPGVHVLLAAIIPIGHEAANARVRAYNAALRGLASELDRGSSRVLLVDQFSGFDAAKDTYDGLHPNDSGMRKMAARWLSALEVLR